MNNQIKNIVLLLLLSTLTVELNAQGDGKFSVKSVTASIGWYKPSMDYWNDEYLSILGIDKKFEGNLSIGSQIEFSLPAKFRCRIGGSYWSDNVKPADENPFKELKISFTRFSLAGIYAFDNANLPIIPYLGFQGTFFMIKNSLEDNTGTSTEQGQDYSWAPLVGVEKTLINHLIIGIEFKYHLGRYVQDALSFIGLVDKTVHISGSEINFKIGYKF